jgi:hypothetical protein
MKYVLLLLALSAGAGCADDDIGLVVKHFAAVESPDCFADPAGNLLQSRGLLDVGVLDLRGIRGYTIAPVVGNNLLLPTAQGTTPETNTVTLTGFDVQLIPPPGDAEMAAAMAQVPPEFFIPSAGGRIPPGGVSMVAVFLEVVPFQVARALAQGLQTTGLRQAGPLIARMRPVGQRAGAKINGGYIDFPIDICEFCLNPVVACPPDGFAVEDIRLTCFPGQDLTATCCNSNGVFVCGDEVPKKTTM